MIVTELELTNFRAYDSAKFTFKPGINLIAGVNGAGKSTILDAIRILVSRASREILKNREAIIEIGVRDIRRGYAFTHLAIEFGMPTEEMKTVYQYEGQINREDFIPSKSEGDVRNEGTTLENAFDFVTPKPLFRAPGCQPLCIFFSPHRSLLTHEVSTSSAKNAAFAQALGERRFNLQQVADWWIAQEHQAQTNTKYKRRLEALNFAVQTFMPTFVKVGPKKEGKISDLEIWKLDSPHTRCNRLTGRDLSDGERGILALVLEVSRRLSLAYPDTNNPNLEGSACVLIDEIDLHLHPQWQRDVMAWLARTFPNCQFIATTHSPQIIGEVEAERVHMLGKEPLDQTLGMDSAWILRNDMDTSDRSKRFQLALREVEDRINAKSPDEALKLIERIEQEIGPFDKLQALRTKAELMLRLRR